VNQGPCKIDPKTGLYDDRCVYDLLPQFDPVSSLMSNHSIDSVKNFLIQNTEYILVDTCLLN